MSDHAAATSPRGGALWRYAPLLAFAALGVLFAWALFNPTSDTLQSQLMGEPAPEFSLPLLDRSAAPGPDGVTPGGFSQADLGGGKVTIVNLWASWCAPCREEHPQLIELAKRDDVEIYGVAFQDRPEASRRFLGYGAAGETYVEPHCRDSVAGADPADLPRDYCDPFTKVGVDQNGLTALRWGVEGVPETFLLDGEGRVILKHSGAITPAILAERFAPAIERANAALR